MKNLRDKIANAAFEVINPNSTMTWEDACQYERAAEAILALPEAAGWTSLEEVSEALVNADERIEELEEHISDLLVDLPCACGHDNPTDICLGHMPAFRKAEALLPVAYRLGLEAAVPLPRPDGASTWKLDPEFVMHVTRAIQIEDGWDTSLEVVETAMLAAEKHMLEAKTRRALTPPADLVDQCKREASHDSRT